MAGIRNRRRSSGKLSLQSMSIHFAAVTLVATGLLALFAGGESTKATAAQAVAAGPTEDAISKAAHGQGTNAIVIRPGTRSEGSFGPDGAPPESTGSLAYASGQELGYEPGQDNPFAQPPVTPPIALPATLPPGMTLEEWLARNKDPDKDVTQIQLSPAELQAMAASPSASTISPVAPQP